MLKPGFTLPPLMFTLEEIEALALGARWVEGRADEGLARAAKDALAKIAAVLPPDRAAALDWPTLLAGAGRAGEAERAALPLARKALAEERKLGFGYADKDGPTEPAGRLAGGGRLLRRRDDARRLVRDPRGLSPLPPRPHGVGRGPARPPAEDPAEPAPGLAAGGGAGGVGVAGPIAVFDSEWENSTGSGAIFDSRPAW